MKIFTSITIFLLSLNTIAAIFEENCSSADARLKITTGLSKNTVTLTEAGLTPQGYYEESATEYSLADVRIQKSDEASVVNEVNSTCENGYGWENVKTITTKKVTVTKDDGSEFPKKTAGLSKDKKSVEKYVICESEVKEQVRCD